MGDVSYDDSADEPAHWGVQLFFTCLGVILIAAISFAVLALLFTNLVDSVSSVGISASVALLCAATIGLFIVGVLLMRLLPTTFRVDHWPQLRNALVIGLLLAAFLAFIVLVIGPALGNVFENVIP